MPVRSAVGREWPTGLRNEASADMHDNKSLIMLFGKLVAFARWRDAVQAKVVVESHDLWKAGDRLTFASGGGEADIRFVTCTTSL